MTVSFTYPTTPQLPTLYTSTISSYASDPSWRSPRPPQHYATVKHERAFSSITALTNEKTVKPRPSLTNTLNKSTKLLNSSRYRSTVNLEVSTPGYPVAIALRDRFICTTLATISSATLKAQSCKDYPLEFKPYLESEVYTCGVLPSQYKPSPLRDSSGVDGGKTSDLRDVLNPNSLTSYTDRVRREKKIARESGMTISKGSVTLKKMRESLGGINDNNLNESNSESENEVVNKREIEDGRVKPWENSNKNIVNKKLWRVRESVK